MTDSSNPYDSIKITMEKDKVQTGYIRVAAQIIQDLSSGIYSSPAIALKELVNNSYDANATKLIVAVNFTFSPIFEDITVIFLHISLTAMNPTLSGNLVSLCASISPCSSYL